MNDALQTNPSTIIRNDPRALPVRPNFTDYEYEHATFSWMAARGTMPQALRGIARELPLALNTVAPLRALINLDSTDCLNFLIVLHEQLGIDIPDLDYAEMQTLDAIVAYLGRRPLP